MTKSWRKMFLTKKLPVLVPFLFTALFFYYMIFVIWHDPKIKLILPFSEPQINIILLETKIGKVHLTLREVCSIESAAVHHPDARITLYDVNGRTDERDELARDVASHYSTIHFQPLNIDDLFINTPLEKWNEDKYILGSKYPTEHLSDAVRLALLWKHGGLYMDTDTIIIKPFYQFENAIGEATVFGLPFAGNGVMVFQKNSTFIYEAMQLFHSFYIGFLYLLQGPILISYLLTVFCDAFWLSTIVNKPELCQTIRFLPQKAFYPLTYYEIYKLFEKQFDDSVDFSQSYAVHLFGSSTRNYVVKAGAGSGVEALFKLHCPYTYQHMLKKKTF